MTKEQAGDFPVEAPAAVASASSQSTSASSQSAFLSSQSTLPSAKPAEVEAAGSATLQPRYFYKYNRKLNLGNRTAVAAWRKVFGSEGEEPSLPLEVGNEQDDGDHIIAKCAVGDTHQLGLTVKRLKLLQSAHRQNADSQGPLWTGTHVPTSNSLKLFQLTDRNLLCRLHMSSKYMADFRVDRHGSSPAEPEQQAVLSNENEAVQQCLAFALPLLGQFASGEIEEAVALKKRLEMGNT